MKTIIKFKTLAILLLLTMGLAGCSKSHDDIIDENTEINIANNTIPLQLKNKEKLPKWLTERIEELEKEPLKKWARIRVYQCLWIDTPAYLIYNTLSSCLYCDFYQEDGTLITYTEDVKNNAKDWKCVYIIN